MDKQTAKQNLKELRDSLSKVLDGKEYQSADEIKEQSKEAIQQARSASKQLKKSLIEKIKDLPVVQKVSELGTAGSVAVSTAAVAQTTVAIDQTEVFVASVANDVVEERIEVPFFIDTFVDFHHLNDWGQAVIAEKVAEVSGLQQISTPAAGSSDTKLAPSASSESSPSDKASPTSQPEQTEKSQESEQKQQEVKEDKSSKNNEPKGDSEKDKGDKQSQSQESKTEEQKKSQEESSSKSDTKSEGVKDFPIVHTPIDDPMDDVKPHRQVSPSM